MPVKIEKELGEAQRSLWLKAVAAVELRNYGYAISLLQGILKQEPEFLTGRQLLRRTETTKAKTENPARNPMTPSTNTTTRSNAFRFSE